MTKPDTLLDYGRRIARVVDHIAAHLDEALELERLAAVACFSPYHFHRIYRAMTGETAADTLRRLRLHRAAGDLVKGGDGMVQVARRAGYGSVEAFTRAFGQVYGLSPGAYRRQGRLVPPPDQPPDEERNMHDVTIRDLPPLRVAAMAHQGPYMDIGTTFERLYAWAAGRGLVDRTRGPLPSITTTRNRFRRTASAPRRRCWSTDRSLRTKRSARLTFPAAGTPF